MTFSRPKLRSWRLTKQVRSPLGLCCRTLGLDQTDQSVVVPNGRLARARGLSCRSLAVRRPACVYVQSSLAAFVAAFLLLSLGRWGGLSRLVRALSVCCPLRQIGRSADQHVPRVVG